MNRLAKIYILIKNKSMPSYLIARTEEREIPFLKVFERILDDERKDVGIAFIGTDHHYSLHEAKVLNLENQVYTIRQNNQEIDYPVNYTGKLPIIYTSFDTDKEVSAWDKEIEEIAVSLHLSPYRHIKYYENRVLPLGMLNTFLLGGRRIFLKEISNRKKYDRDNKIIIDMKSDQFFLETCFSLKKHNDGNTTFIETNLGYIYFQIIKSDD